jgi:hypothetical protein
MKAYRNKKTRSNVILLNIESPKDKQIAFQLNATIKKDNLAVLPIDTENEKSIIKIFKTFLSNDVLVDENTNKFLNRALEAAGKRKRKLNKLNGKLNIIKRRLQNKDSFDEHIGICEELLPHQKAGAIIANTFNRFAFYYDTGTGKTVLALEIIAQKEQKENASFLILCPKTIIKTAWMNDCLKFYPKMKLLPLSKNITIDDYKKIYLHWNKIDADVPLEERFIDSYAWDVGSVQKRLEKIQNQLIPRAKHYIVNPELFKLNIEFYEDLEVEGLIVDESSMLKNYYSEISTDVRIFSQHLKYVYLLSGKPAPNHTLEYFPQMKVIDPKSFSMSFGKYKEMYYKKEGLYETDHKFKSKDCEREVIRLIGSRSITLAKEDCLKLPEKTYQFRKLVIPTKAREKYYEMLTNYYIKFKEKEKEHEVNVATKLASLMKLRQITSGFIIKDGQELFLHDEKEKELLNVLDEIGSHQAIIWCQFQYEINRIYNLLKKRNKNVVTAFGNTKDVDDSILKFKNGVADYIIAHPKTLKYGVTLTNCSYAIYYSMSYSHEEFYQSHDRIYRKGQINKCTYIFIQAENTIDERIYEVVQNKKSEIELFEMLMKDAEKIVAIKEKEH